jgi:DinB superfamily
VTYAITLEHGSDGSYLAWVHQLPGCFARGATRDEVLANVADAIVAFRDWLRACGEDGEDDEVAVVVAAEVESVIEADEDTEVLLAADREPLTEEDWRLIGRWLDHSRQSLLRAIAALDDRQLERRVEGRERTAREQLTHIGFVDLMYAAWTFDLDSRDGLADFLNWTRAVSRQRMEQLAHRQDASLTTARWGGAPRPEPWTARKAARRMIWHELLHLPEIAD